VEPEQQPVKPIPRGGSETILLVDDEEYIRDFAIRILTQAGYKVLAAPDGKQALELFQANREEIALVVLDLIMPRMGGKQCLQGLLEVDPSLKVVIASGHTAVGPTGEALAAGAKRSVNKPYESHELLQVVREVLDTE